jgi:PKD repeat protein
MYKLLIFLFSSTIITTFAQSPTYSANDTVVPYLGNFRPGLNLGRYAPFTDEDLADLAAGNLSKGVDGVGMKCLRPGLFEDFLEVYGYDIRVNTFKYYDSLDLKDNTLIVGFPSKQHQDPKFYCNTNQSQLFANLYEPIWDNGANGTPINENNYYANYIYKVALKYKNQVKFWEIWNEPGFDYTKNKGFLPPGALGNWWDNNPDPCDYKLRAPIFHYVRLLKISYEVIKSVDPSALVCVSGVGYPSFLDAILRNTDNPLDGTVTPSYPLKGGAYFDVMGFHSYPHFDGSLRKWNDTKLDWDYFRQSDAAAAGIDSSKQILSTVLKKYGYNGIQYPLKHWIVTECNVPRKEFGEFIGSDEAQKNFMIKSYVQCYKSNIKQIHYYKIAEEQTYNDATFEFDLMGLYKKLDYKQGLNQFKNSEGIAANTATKLLYGLEYDPIKTNQLLTNNLIDGGAFKDKKGNFTYVLWAKCLNDRSENANASFNFPTNFNLTKIQKRNWNFSLTQKDTFIKSTNIQLNGTPIFLIDTKLEIDKLPVCTSKPVTFSSLNNKVSWIFEGANITTSTSNTVTLNFPKAGVFNITLNFLDNSNNIINTIKEKVFVDSIPKADFVFSNNGNLYFFNNKASFNTKNYNWNFGNNVTDTVANPINIFNKGGIFNIKLKANNQCGTDSITKQLSINGLQDSLMPYSALDTILFKDQNFRSGTNIKFFPPYTDMDIANIAVGNKDVNVEGIGAKSLRTILPEYFLNSWTTDIRLPELEHFNNIGASSNIVTLGFPDVLKIDHFKYCPQYESVLFANMYQSIWDNGKNGTAYNDSNYLAKYCYDVAKTYKGKIKYYEIWNAPGTDITGDKGWLPKGVAGNWWENNPDPCDLIIHAPIYHYIRMLRIAYETIKSVDPDAIITVPDLAYVSFLDAIMRNTDNPIDGRVDNEFSKKGGAYFDAVAFSSYPHLDGSTKYYDLNQGKFIYTRHSDACVEGLIKTNNQIKTLTQSYGFDGKKYPNKLFIVAKANIPRKQFDDFIGSDIAQLNYTIKSLVTAQANNIKELHIDGIAESENFMDATSETQVMGLYQKLTGLVPYNRVLNNSGIGFATTSQLLYTLKYDSIKTKAMNLPSQVKGFAFKDNNSNKYTYVLWAKTNLDNTETASTVYTFPSVFNFSKFLKNWDYSKTKSTSIATNAINLIATPVFLQEDTMQLLLPLAKFKSDTTIGCTNTVFNFTNKSENGITYKWTFEGGIPSTSILFQPQVIFDKPGKHTVTLETKNGTLNHIFSKTSYINIIEKPIASFDFIQNGYIVQFNDKTTNKTNLFWDFGDGTNEQGFNPSHFYTNNGTFKVKLIASNACGSDTTSKTIIISNKPIANFDYLSNGCGIVKTQFQDFSIGNATSWIWKFSSGTPNTSTDRNPLITFTNINTVNVTLIVSNGIGKDTLTKTIPLFNKTIQFNTIDICENETKKIGNKLLSISNQYVLDTLKLKTPGGCDSLVISNNYAKILKISTKILIDTIKNATYLFNNKILTTSGIYKDTLINAAGCDSIITLNLIKNTSINNLSFATSITVFPNPFSSLLQLNINSKYLCSLKINILDVLGQAKFVMNNIALNQGDNILKLENLKISAGTYLLQLHTIYGDETIKVIKM